jgi:hypothetical protein
MDISRTFWMFTAFALVALAASPVFAGHGDQTVEFDQLELGITQSDQLRLNYKISGADWERLQHDGVHPELNFYTVDEDEGRLRYTYNYDLASQGGSFTLPSEIDAFDLEQVQIEVLGFAEDWRVRSLAAHGVVGARLAFDRRRDEFSVAAVSARHSHRAPADFDYSQPDDDEDEHDHGDDEEHADNDEPEDTDEEDEADEPTLVRDSSKYKAQVIQACNDVTTYDSEMKACTGYAMDFRVEWAVDAVETCDDITTHSSDFKKCLKASRDYETHNPSEVARACDEVATHQSDVQNCLQAGSAYTAAPAPMIEACGAASDFNSDAMGCIQKATRLDEGGAEIIRACSGQSLESCIERAAQ